MNLYSRITGTGSALPQRCVTNTELVTELASRGIQSSDSWISERTGIKQRYLASFDETTSSLASTAAQRALQAAGKSAAQVDLIVVATSTPDLTFPSTACLVQAQLGAAKVAAFDVQAVCSGFVYALTTADALIRTGAYRCALVIGAEVFSRLLDWNDRSTCVLFGDGAGAVLLEASSQPGIRAAKLHADGSLQHILCAAGHIKNGGLVGNPFVQMDGQSVFKVAVRVLEDSAREVLRTADMKAEQLDWVIPHQANVRILHATAQRLGLPLEKLVVTVDQHGNTSAASVPLALDVAVWDGRIQSGQHLLLQGVGGGFTWGSVLLTF